MKSHQVEYWLSKIEPLDASAIKALNDFFSKAENLNLTSRTKAEYARIVYNLLRISGKRLAEITQKDIEHYLACRSKEIAELTLFHEFTVLRRFLRYLGVEIDFKMRASRKVKNHIDTNQFLTDEEFERLLKACKNPRDKALLMILRETGIRISEALSLNIEDVKFDRDLVRLYIKHPKVGRPRYVTCLKAIPYLRTWISVHPLRENPKAPLFVELKGEPERLSYDAIFRAIKRTAKRAGIKKRVHPHLFRHQVATELLSLNLSEELVRRFMGWTSGSRMVKNYSHVTDEKANKAINIARGYIKPREEKKKPDFTRCPRCDQVISTDFKFCPYCGQSLDLKINLFQAELNMALMRLAFILEKNPQLLDKLLRWASKQKDQSMP